jgi:hypothetical protein
MVAQRLKKSIKFELYNIILMYYIFWLAGLMKIKERYHEVSSL